MTTGPREHSESSERPEREIFLTLLPDVFSNQDAEPFMRQIAQEVRERAMERRQSGISSLVLHGTGRGLWLSWRHRSTAELIDVLQAICHAIPGAFWAVFAVSLPPGAPLPFPPTPTQVDALLRATHGGVKRLLWTLGVVSDEDARSKAWEDIRTAYVERLLTHMEEECRRMTAELLRREERMTVIRRMLEDERRAREEWRLCDHFLMRPGALAIMLRINGLPVRLLSLPGGRFVLEVAGEGYLQTNQLEPGSLFKGGELHPRLQGILFDVRVADRGMTVFQDDSDAVMEATERGLEHAREVEWRQEE